MNSFARCILQIMCFFIFWSKDHTMDYDNVTASSIYFQSVGCLKTLINIDVPLEFKDSKCWDFLKLHWHTCEDGYYYWEFIELFFVALPLLGFWFIWNAGRSSELNIKNKVKTSYLHHALMRIRLDLQQALHFDCNYWTVVVLLWYLLLMQ